MISSSTVPLLEVRRLSVDMTTVGGQHLRPVREVSFHVSAGETVGIVGESGSGKSTLALALTGLHSRLVNVKLSGGVSFDGEELMSLNQDRLRRVRGSKVGYVFQSPEASLDPTRTVGRQIVDVIRYHQQGLSRKAMQHEAIDLLDRVGLPRPDQAVRRFPHEFSGGQQQRVVIAVAIANRPKLLIADEPTSALDVLVQETVLDLLRSIQKDTKMAVIFISHDLRVVSRMAERTIVMYGGTLAEVGPTNTVLASPRHWYTVGLLQAIPDPHGDYRSQDRLRAIDGNPPSPAEIVVGCPFAERCPRAAHRCRHEPPTLDRISPDDERNHLAACWFPATALAVPESSRGS